MVVIVDQPALGGRPTLATMRNSLPAPLAGAALAIQATSAAHAVAWPLPELERSAPVAHGPAPPEDQDAELTGPADIIELTTDMASR